MLTDNIRQYMKAKHEKEIVKEADVIERRQVSPSPDHEKGPRDKKLSEVTFCHVCGAVFTTLK
jgi:hypothetical protein